MDLVCPSCCKEVKLRRLMLLYIFLKWCNSHVVLEDKDTMKQSRCVAGTGCAKDQLTSIGISVGIGISLVGVGVE